MIGNYPVVFVCPSVCPSVRLSRHSRVGIVSKRRKRRKLGPGNSPGTLVLPNMLDPETRNGSPQVKAFEERKLSALEVFLTLHNFNYVLLTCLPTYHGFSASQPHFTA